MQNPFTVYSLLFPQCAEGERRSGGGGMPMTFQGPKLSQSGAYKFNSPNPETAVHCVPCSCDKRTTLKKRFQSHRIAYGDLGHTGTKQS